MIDTKDKKPELLAPAGSVTVFEGAIKAGADAVYIGAPALNARALSKDFTPAEIAAMVEYAHSKGVRLYLAANSLLKEDEIPQAVETLAMLEALQPDALIVQDLGVYHLCRQYFPRLRLHASTLFGAHNSLAVQQFANMGFSRVVLARELTLKEIGAIAQKSSVELEVFIHGALCFSYSGLCLFSSYLGGKSGLRGRCVQPCRRQYHWQKKDRKQGYLFSMNDLSGVDLLPQLRHAGVSSLKIEGRLRSAHYVSSVVKAYRMVIDAPAGDRENLENARELLAQAMGRKTSPGYFSTPQPKELISPYHSGNIGLYLGRAAKGTGRGKVSLSLKHPLQAGDRLRLHQEATGERVAFTLRTMTKAGQNISHAGPGDSIILEVPAAVKKGDSLFKVDSRQARESEKMQSGIATDRYSQGVRKFLRKAKQKAAAVHSILAAEGPGRKKNVRAMKKDQKGRGRGSTALYIKIDDLQVLKLRFPLIPELFLVELNPKTFADLPVMQKVIKKYHHKIAWCLPPVILENELDFYRKAISQLLKSNFSTWQIGHIGQHLFFDRNQRLSIMGDYTLNILNSQGLYVLDALRMQRAQTAIEIDRKDLKAILASRTTAKVGTALGMTVYGTPPLFTARSMAPHFAYDQFFVSPRGESFLLRKAWNGTIALAESPFSLLQYLSELAKMGLAYGVIDLCHRKITRKETDAIGRELAGRGPRKKLSSFNYNGSLL
jgi:putative protease